MTKQEQKRFVENFQARRTSRVVNAQSGYAEVFQAANPSTQFDSDPPSGTARTDSVGDPQWDGSVAREVPDEAWQTDVANALEHVNRAISSIGATNRSVDDGTLAGLNLLASTMQKLTELPSGVAIRKAVPNPDGPTEDVRHVPDNANSSLPGPRPAYVSVSELEAAASKQTTLSARIVQVERL
jgi:hypothetical protein